MFVAPRWLKRSLPFMIITIVVILFFNKLALSDLILARGDTYNYFYPYWTARNQALQQGQLPLWTSQIFMGVPLLANPQLGTFYPPNWLTIPLNAPDAYRISVLCHVIWAGIGMSLLFRTVVSKALIPTLVAASIYALSGYLGAHAEQINQLQGLSWMPFLLYAYHRGVIQRQRTMLYIMVIAWTMQIFSGHTQTVFMTGILLGLYAILTSLTADHRVLIVRISRRLLLLALLAGSASLLALPQLLPTLELTGMSNRGGGFNASQATAFSLPLPYLPRAVLPSYDGQLFTEYIAYLGVIALVLALYACLIPRRASACPWTWILIAAIGLSFALGRFNPLYWFIAELPGFNLFRVPARWLSLYTLASAILAGQATIDLTQQRIYWRPLLLAWGAALALMLLAYISPIQQRDIVGAAQPTQATLWAWGMAALAILLIVRLPARLRPIIASVVIIVELFVAAQILPYNDLVPRETYLGQRFPISQLLALGDDQVVPARLLSMSGRLFNLGDMAALQARFGRYQMDAHTQDIALVALKNQETLIPNLGLQWAIPTIDGYGGGILPTIYYTQLTSLLLPEGQLRVVDGRIGEALTQAACRGACVPPLAYLQMTDTRYLIMDKVYDVAHDGIFYDTALAAFWDHMPQMPTFAFTELHILHTGDLPAITSETFAFQGTNYQLARVDWAQLSTLIGTVPQQILAISAVDARTQTFVQLTPQPFERVLSSDIKLYRIAPTRRYHFAERIMTTPDDWQGHEHALTILQTQADALVLHDAPLLDGVDPESASATITHYDNTHIELQATVPHETYLMLADAYYPGWQATVNGQPVPVYRANVLFRAVPLITGTNHIVLDFVPRLWYLGLGLGVLAWGILCALYLWDRWHSRNRDS